MSRDCLIITSKPGYPDIEALIRTGKSHRCWRLDDQHTADCWYAFAETTVRDDLSDKWSNYDRIFVAYHPVDPTQSLGEKFKERVLVYSHDPNDPLFHPHLELLIKELFKLGDSDHLNESALSAMRAVFRCIDDPPGRFRTLAVRLLAALAARPPAEQSVAPMVDAFLRNCESIPLASADRQLVLDWKEHDGGAPLLSDDARYARIKSLRDILLGSDDAVVQGIVHRFSTKQ